MIDHYYILVNIEFSLVALERMRSKLLPLRSSAHQKREVDLFLVDLFYYVNENYFLICFFAAAFLRDATVLSYMIGVPIMMEA